MRVRYRLMAVLMVTTSVAIGCGTSEKKASSPPQTGGGSDQSAVREGGVFRGPIQEPLAIDPYNVSESNGSRVTKRLFAGLVTFDGNPDLATRPGVAERWSENADCTQWTFNLRRSKFSNGEDVTAESFIRGWTRAADGRAASRVAGHLAGIQGYDALHGTGTAPPTATTFSGLSAPDPQTLVVKLSSPDCEFDKKTLLEAFSPVPTVAGSFDNRTYNEAPIGNGQFMIKPGTKWEHDRGISLVPNPSYYGPKPHIEGIEFVILPAQPPGAAYQALEAGELDAAGVPLGQQKQAESAYAPKGGFVKYIPYSISYVQPNDARGPLKEPDARRAVSLAIDRTGISQAVANGYWLPATALLPPPFGSSYQPGVCDACRFDPTGARELAGRSGLTPGTHLRFLAVSANPLVLAYKDQLEKNLGVVVDIDIVSSAESVARLGAGDYDLSALNWSADYPTPDNFLYPLLGKGSKQNSSGYDNAELNGLIQRGRAQKDAADRRRIYQEAERMAIGRDLALIPAFVQPTLYVFNADKWAGVDFDFFGQLKYDQLHLK